MSQIGWSQASYKDPPHSNKTETVDTLSEDRGPRHFLRFVEQLSFCMQQPLRNACVNKVSC